MRVLTTEVIILAQGTQQRMGMVHGYKQVLPLEACGNTPIIVRTLAMLKAFRRRDGVHVTLVAWDKMMDEVCIRGIPTLEQRWAWACDEIDDHVELPDPGNSSLKGIARYLERRGATHQARHTIVLLGDVVYSWACLEALWRAASAYGFVGTSDLSESGGELWGVAWARAHESTMLQDLRDALLRHPPFEDDYQPGQMRRWLMGMRRGDLRTRIAKMRAASLYIDIDDYTMDVDLPQHISLLDAVSYTAVIDDVQHGLWWDTTTSPPGRNGT